MMYLKGLMISQFLVLLVVRNSLADCVPCALLNGCPELNCLGEKVLGMCGCCYVCAKQLGESCGGLYGLIGTCDQGLRCVLPLQQVNETMTIIYHVGVCQGVYTKYIEKFLNKKCLWSPYKKVIATVYLLDLFSFKKKIGKF